VVGLVPNVAVVPANVTVEAPTAFVEAVTTKVLLKLFGVAGVVVTPVNDTVAPTGIRMSALKVAVNVDAPVAQLVTEADEPMFRLPLVA
jgi:hypothetical protein